jgi:hypothetical protein
LEKTRNREKFEIKTADRSVFNFKSQKEYVKWIKSDEGDKFLMFELEWICCDDTNKPEDREFHWAYDLNGIRYSIYDPFRNLKMLDEMKWNRGKFVRERHNTKTIPYRAMYKVSESWETLKDQTRKMVKAIQKMINMYGTSSILEKYKKIITVERDKLEFNDRYLFCENLKELTEKGDIFKKKMAKAMIKYEENYNLKYNLPNQNLIEGEARLNIDAFVKFPSIKTNMK